MVHISMQIIKVIVSLGIRVIVIVLMRRREKSSRSENSFRIFYHRGDLPVIISLIGSTRQIRWLCDPNLLNSNFYLPIFLSGISETENPYSFLIDQIIMDLLRIKPNFFWSSPKILSEKIREGLLSRSPIVINRSIDLTTRLIIDNKHLIEDQLTFIKEILPCLKKHYESQHSKHRNSLDRVFESCEKIGGPLYLKEIKKYLPTYQSMIVLSI